ncbi:hypothetical protein [Neolewinella antarctica]|uniref:Uncharacterized protein n=1 Tax=Neolewinella antarctica TaxID=442734 RepID=A0ABX0XCN5_9BACT|nr:hypothetical protein [Neolewinella antarctica]NJC27016.1 hypothetical protein [Neolewinella antarctica]
MTVQEQIGFTLTKISQRSITIRCGVTITTAQPPIDGNIGFGAVVATRSIVVIPTISFLQDDEAFISLSIEVVFALRQTAWEALVTQDGHLLIPAGFAQHLGVIAIGSCRGYLSAKLEADAAYRDIILPTIDLTKMLVEDVLVELA